MRTERPLLCRWGWHRWTRWAMPARWRYVEERRCQRKGCTAVERRDEMTKERMR